MDHNSIYDTLLTDENSDEEPELRRSRKAKLNQKISMLDKETQQVIREDNADLSKNIWKLNEIKVALKKPQDERSELDINNLANLLKK